MFREREGVEPRESVFEELIVTVKLSRTPGSEKWCTGEKDICGLFLHPTGDSKGVRFAVQTSFDDNAGLQAERCSSPR